MLPTLDAPIFQSDRRREPRRIVILGATGSIGQSTADVISGAPGWFDVVAVVGGRDVAALGRIARQLNAKLAVIADPSAYAALRDELSGSGIEAGAGPQAAIDAALRPADLVVGAIAGAAGVEPTHAAVAAGRTVALANKECLVCAGPAFMRTAAAAGATLLPMDSEHNAIFQALGGADPKSVERMILTASGGPFRTWTREAIDTATPEQALAHPNWSMGPKITIDSASLMNKGLEVIEAHYIFGVPADRLDVLVHPQSIVHGLVTFSDGSVTAGMAQPDMRVPIAHCLGYPDRVKTNARRLDLAEIGTLTFDRPDFDRFPALRVALEALAHGNGLPTVLNAANEIAVAAFLDRECGFRDIARCAEQVCTEFARNGDAHEPESIADALALDRAARDCARKALS
ncbi:MAG: 1-deoxy-D-xylulose-5-phosphate reductoisomerase [Beijerinckiaceae bacterium]|nr:1-deoxy-D-xylulose-5-phosphate reductoisomerase [Beijerinckiaceae bacterium]